VTENKKPDPWELLREARVSVQFHIGLLAWSNSHSPLKTDELAKTEKTLNDIDSALAEPIVDPVQDWKDANGYDDFLKAYSKIVDERNEAQIQANEAYNRGAQVGYESALKIFKQTLRLSTENMLFGQNGVGLLGNGNGVKEE
jgi:hypothetical protein